MFKLVLNYPAIFIQKISSIVIADLHIGIEREIGININASINKLVENILKIAKSTKAKNLVILGDVKHEIVEIEKYLLYFFEGIKNEFEKIFICKGNHDALIEKNINFENVEIKGSRGFKLDRFGFFHGHAKPLEEVKKCSKIFLGHFQPAIKIDEKVEKCFLISKKFVILPSFNPFSGYFDISEIKLPSFLKVKKFDVYLLNGVKVKEIAPGGFEPPSPGFFHFSKL